MNIPIPKIPKNPQKFICKLCDYTTSNKKDYTKHENTIKHTFNINPNKSYLKNPIKIYYCVCGKEYKHTSTLSTHKKKCKMMANNIIMNNNENNENIIIHDTPTIDKLTNLIMEVVKSNSDLQKQTLEMQQQMIDVCKNSNTIINNNNNKTFNMHVFLNEQCKDAMNIMDFVNSMTLEFADLEAVGKLGYVEGISGIIIKKLNELDIYKRPIHCSDAKREIMFVKDDNIWEKENSTYDKLRKAIKYVTKKNSDMLIPWSKKYPACMNTSHPLNDTYIQLMGQAMGGKEEFVDSENKIMKKIAKAVLIDKA